MVIYGVGMHINPTVLNIKLNCDSCVCIYSMGYGESCCDPHPYTGGPWDLRALGGAGGGGPGGRRAAGVREGATGAASALDKGVCGQAGQRGVQGTRDKLS